MTRPGFAARCGALLLAAATLWWIDGPDAAPSRAGSSSSPTLPARADASCKPLGPVALTLEQTSGGAGGAAQLAFSLEPKRELASLRWELRCSEGVLPLEGAVSGEADPGRGNPSVGGVRVDVPADGAHHKVVLAAMGVFEAGDGDGAHWLEPFEVTATLRWGQPRPDAPVVARVAIDGELEQAVVLPSTWREGR